jgi:hypothetical protein
LLRCLELSDIVVEVGGEFGAETDHRCDSGVFELAPSFAPNAFDLFARSAGPEI